MNYSIYIVCKSVEQRDELFTNFVGNFKFPTEEDECYLGTDLSYVLDEYRDTHFGFEMHSTGYFTDFVVICLAIIARKYLLNVYWDYDNLKVDQYGDDDLATIQNFISRKVRDRKKIMKTYDWKLIYSCLLNALGLYLENRAIRKVILEKCNKIIYTIRYS